MFCDLTSNLIISGCDSTLTVLGMSAVISSVAHYLGLSILAFIGIREGFFYVAEPSMQIRWTNNCENAIKYECVFVLKLQVRQRKRTSV